MKGVILAGGRGSRLFPLTKAINKHLLPIGQFPMIYYSLYKLGESGIKDIFIVTGPQQLGYFTNLLGSGRSIGVHLSYIVQDHAGGIADALRGVERFCQNEKMVVLLGDNIFEDSLTPFIQKFKEQKKGARILLKEVMDPERYGIATVNQGKIESVEEKPVAPKSNLCVTGIYMYDTEVFSIINQMVPSNRGELEITDVNAFYLAKGNLDYEVLNGWWIDAGTISSLSMASQLVMTSELHKDMIKFFKKEANS